MKRMTQQNLQNIRCRFTEKTGVDLTSGHRPQAARKVLVLALTALFCAFMVAFTYPLFSSLQGDELSFRSVYEGNGVFSIQVENRSGRELCFQEQLKLMRWSDSAEVISLGGSVTFENTEIRPHSQGTMVIDLSEAYDIPSLERESGEDYYLVLTNNNFLFGQDWMCSIQFTKEPSFREETVPETSVMSEAPTEATLPPMPVESLIAEEIEEELRFYFEESYLGMPVSSNGQNFTYLQRGQELLARFDGTVIPPAEPMLILRRLPEGVLFDGTVPESINYLLAGQQRHSVDGYGRLVGTGMGEHSLQLMALLPTYPGEIDGGVSLPLLHFFTYEIAMTEQEDAYAFVYGRLLSFEEMESCKVYQDGQYAVYEMTDLFYTDLDAYIDDFLATDQRIYFDDAIRHRVHNIYDYYKDPEILAESFHYHLPGICPELPAE